jgi:hypothetical protein
MVHGPHRPIGIEDPGCGDSKEGSSLHSPLSALFESPQYDCQGEEQIGTASDNIPGCFLDLEANNQLRAYDSLAKENAVGQLSR